MLRAGNSRKWTHSNLVVAVRYTFEKCQPEQVSYQLDFLSHEKSERASYLQLFKDCGWEHITNFNGFSYFRKAHSEIEFGCGVGNLYDATGKLAMVKRILTMRCFLHFTLLQLYYRCFSSKFPR